MRKALDRRHFFAGALTAPWLARQGSAEAAEETGDDEPTLDVHIHLFGLGDAGSGCRLSKATTEGPVFKLLTEKLRLRQRAKTLDEGYVAALAEQIRGSGLTKGLILAQDAVYDRNGRPDFNRTHFYVPNDYLLRVTKQHARWMIPCVSINPDRADVLDELGRCVEAGARVLKIHPPAQGVDPADKKHTRFFRRCAELKVVVMVHTGHEHSTPIVDVGLASPGKLALALDQGCTVIACHCGTGWPVDRPDMLGEFLAMVRKYENLWGDTSVLGSVGRVRDFGRLLAERDVVERLLHGSDFPFPAMPLAFAGTLGLAKATNLQAIRNPIQQDYALKEALGIGQASARRAYRLIVDEPR